MVRFLSLVWSHPSRRPSRAQRPKGETASTLVATGAGRPAATLVAWTPGTQHDGTGARRGCPGRSVHLGRDRQRAGAPRARPGLRRRRRCHGRVPAHAPLTATAGRGAAGRALPGGHAGRRRRHRDHRVPAHRSRAAQRDSAGGGHPPRAGALAAGGPAVRLVGGPGASRAPPPTSVGEPSDAPMPRCSPRWPSAPAGPRRSRSGGWPRPGPRSAPSLAREMHDVLAHRLSLLATYAGALEYRPDASPEQRARAAGVIREGCTTRWWSCARSSPSSATTRTTTPRRCPCSPTCPRSWTRPGGRWRGHPGGRGHRRRLPAGDRPDRLPGGAGGADQRPQARRRASRPGRAHRRPG